MKLRILGNSLRLRLSVPEVEELLKKGMVSAQITFGENALFYSLEMHSGPDIYADFRDGRIKVEVPEGEGKHWATSEQVSMEAMQMLTDKESLRILIEKDFTCLKPREGEDESQLFPNPQERH